MPCWYYDKKELHSTPSLKDGIEPDLEARYRREGARFIIETGTKMGLRYDTCATGVVYFHRFYMFHSFKEFHRYVTAACCLFLAGKVEETPKKCKDIIKITHSTLTEAQFAVFGEDPKEEVMTLERVLLQTIKFDLQVEHPYSYLLKFSKMIKGDKGKVQKIVQMGWTFINDSLCTTLSLQWEADIIAVALMYLASRLTKFDIQDWQGKPLGHKGKWWEFLVEDANLELLEDVCHQVLDLYSSSNQKGDESPPPPPPPPPKHSMVTPTKHSRPSTPQEVARSHQHSGGAPPAKIAKQETEKSAAAGNIPTTSYSQQNPYVATSMYSSSFMSQEGSESIQSILGGGTTAGYKYQNPGQGQYTSASTGQYPAQPGYSSQTKASFSQPPLHGYPSNFSSQTAQGSYSHSQQFLYTQGSTPTQQQQPQQQQQQQQQPAYQGYQATTPSGSQSSQQHKASYSHKQYASPYNQGQQFSVPPPQTTSSQYQYGTQQQPTPPGPSSYSARPPTASSSSHRSSSKASSGLPPVRITGRR